MSCDNYKNILQEFYQKQRKKLPHYNYKNCGEQQWKAIVTLNDGKKFTSSIHKSKKECDMEAAEKALRYIGLINNTNKDPELIRSQISLHNGISEIKLQKQELKLKKNVVLYVDIENSHKMIDMLISTFDFENLRIFAIKSQSSPSVKGWNSEIVDLIIVDSNVRDASDIYLTMLATTHAFQKSFDEYIIITGDKFGKTLSDFLKSPDLLWNVSSFCFKDFDVLSEHLVSLS